MRSPDNDFDDLMPTPPMMLQLHNAMERQAAYEIPDRLPLADTHSDHPHSDGAPPFYDAPDYAADVRESVRPQTEPLRAYVDGAGRVQIIANDRLPSRGEIVGGPVHTYELSNEQEDTQTSRRRWAAGQEDDRHAMGAVLWGCAAFLVLLVGLGVVLGMAIGGHLAGPGR